MFAHKGVIQINGIQSLAYFKLACSFSLRVT